ncbi:aminopeptidase N [Ignatzschineria ureiclastica]|uniref:Aminopeptidase N n=1 Tax=Ignatzschineria ureiclastica TaxID=472582 RepID=A0A2U2ADV7_9GAMM|nr:aminopeptidase N [Ignatzschineria ureiclastica]PWD80843.1 aminopeptidase N [Ignatzschineria ureiclastica]GGZ94396.1 aminopeptidase N [Ignatzschineria ureiclastica]
MPFTYTNDRQIYRLDYTAPNFTIEQLALEIDLDPISTKVTTQFVIDAIDQSVDEYEVRLHGSTELLLATITIDGKQLDSSEFIFDENDLLIIFTQGQHTVEIVNTINPSTNTELSGIYISNGMFCSDCEPQGFRNITYFPDRPDVMTRYRVTLRADQAYPVLLSNGNLIEEGLLENNRHYAIWEDPFPKPTYLFAIVAGNLAYIEDQHIRPNGSPVRLRVYADQKDIDRCDFAMKSLKKAMQWDEERFGLICDLDFYNIVAVDDFNGGAMENKGLNLFNTSCILASPETANDGDFTFVEAVVGHEYFHNWTGNRITLRDWFNLSLKESLTVFREQEFIGAEEHPGVRRVQDVNYLRTHQFPDDQGPLSHAVRPDTLGSIENIYTTTTYEKGAEIIRLYQTILGKAGFDRGFARYIKEFDGQAVTVDDFYQAMKAENPRLFDHFMLWYSQRGTPIVKASTEYHPDKRELRLSLKQYLFDPVTKESKQPMPIPVSYALFSQTGELLLEETFTLTTHQQCLVFHNIDAEPIISLLRGFSAPVMLDYDYSFRELQTLIAYETDYFSKWEALQNLILKVIFARDMTLDQMSEIIGNAVEPLFDYAYEDPAFCAQMLTIPDEGYYLGLMEVEDIFYLRNIRQTIVRYVATRFQDRWLKLYQDFQKDDAESRAIKNIALKFITSLEEYQYLLPEQYYQSSNMTDIGSALKCAVWQNIPEKQAMLDDFYERYQHYSTLIDRWFSVQESDPNLTLEMLDKIVEHPAFTRNNPNRVRAIVGAVGKNRYALAKVGAPLYQWIANEILEIDRINSITAAKLVTPFTKVARLQEPLQSEVIEIIHTMLKAPNISNNLFDQLKRIVQ